MPRHKKETDDGTIVETTPSGASIRWRVEADALHSKTYTGKVDLGTYTNSENQNGLVQKRVAVLVADGYRNINVREISAE